MRCTFQISLFSYIGLPQAAYCVANICADGRHAASIICLDVIRSYVDLIKTQSAEAQEMAMRFIKFVLEFDPQHGPVLVEEAQGLDALERVQDSPNDALRRLSSDLLDRYFYKEVCCQVVIAELRKCIQILRGISMEPEK